MKGRLLLALMLIPQWLFSQTYFGDTLWTRDYSSSGAFSCSFSPDGTKLAVAYECMGPMVRIIDVNNGHILWESGTPDLCLYNIQFSSNGQYVAIAEELGHLVVVDMTIPDTAYNIDTQSGGLNAVDFSPAGDYIYAGCDDGTVRVYETATGMLHHTIPAHTDAVLSVDVSASGGFLATGSKDNLVKVWDLDNSDQLVYTFTDAMNDIKTVKFTPDGNRLLTGGLDDMLYAYWLQDGSLDTMLMFHMADVNTIDISADNSFAVSGSNDQSAVMFNMHNYQEVATFTNQLQTRVNGVAISPAMDKLAAVNHIGYVIMYNISTLVSVEDQHLLSFTITPNPASDFIYLWGVENMASFEIIDLNGRSVDNGYTSGMIGISHLPNGIYFLKFHNSYSKFIKQ